MAFNMKTFIRPHRYEDAGKHINAALDHEEAERNYSPKFNGSVNLNRPIRARFKGAETRSTKNRHGNNKGVVALREREADGHRFAFDKRKGNRSGKRDILRAKDA